MPIQYYVQVDFDTFVQMIVMIDGVDIYNDEDLVLDRVGAGNDKVKLTCCGMRHLGGKMALAYARGRHTADGDVDRSRRQQKLILAIRDKVLDPDAFPAADGGGAAALQHFPGGHSDQHCRWKTP